MIVRDSTVLSLAGFEIWRSTKHRFDLRRKLPRVISLALHAEGFQQNFAMAQTQLVNNLRLTPFQAVRKKAVNVSSGRVETTKLGFVEGEYVGLFAGPAAILFSWERLEITRLGLEDSTSI